MQQGTIEVRIRGRRVKVPSTQINGNTVIVVGHWLRMASVQDEQWLEAEPIEDPERFVAKLKEQKVKADLFTFSQRLPEIEPRYDYRMEWDNVAAIPIVRFEDWWDKRLPQESRKNVRRANKRGVIVKAVPFDDQLVQGITDVYNADPIRQGIPNVHCGKNFDTIKEEVSTFIERSEFIGAYHENELIGFIKLVYMGRIASILHIVSKNRHQDKRPTNALIAKAVEVCCARGKSHLIYGKYTYGNKTQSPLAEFKRRNGFEEIKFPRYFVPLTSRGRLMMTLKLHRGLIGIVPPGLIPHLLNLRAKFHSVLRATRFGPRQPVNKQIETTDVQGLDRP